MEGKGLNIKEDLKFDINALDKEWVKQPQKYFEYAELLALSEKKRDQAKNKIAMTEAELDGIIRKEFSDKNQKTTEAEVKSLVMLHADRKAAVEDHLNAMYDCSVLKGAVEAFQQRKKALECEVTLWSQGYWSTPKQGLNIINEKASSDQRDGLNKKE